MHKNLPYYFVRMFEKLARLLAGWHVKLKNWHAVWHVGMFIGTLACLLALWHVKMRSWHDFCTLVRKQRRYAGILASRPRWHA